MEELRMRLQSSKRMKKTIAEGRITVPKGWHPTLDNYISCAEGYSIGITYCLQNGTKISGRLYQSRNNTTRYYQFYIITLKDVETFIDQIGNRGIITIDFDLTDHSLYIF